MAQVSFGTITITDTNDIENIYMVYRGAESDTVPPTLDWSSISNNQWKTDITQVSGTYIWQVIVITKSGVAITSSNWTQFYGEPVCITGPQGIQGPQGGTGATGKGVQSVVTYYLLSDVNSGTPSETNWSTTPQTYPSTGTKYYWTKTITTYTDNTTYESGPVYNQALTNSVKDARDANATASDAWNKADDAQEDAATALELAQNTNYAWWSLAQDTTVGQNTFAAGSYGTFVNAETFKASPTGKANIFLDASGIHLRNGLLDLSSLTGTALTFYKPGTTTKSMELTSSALNFYGTSTYTSGGQTIPYKGIEIDSNGIKIYKNDDSNPVAQFGTDTIIGRLNQQHIKISSAGLVLLPADGSYSTEAALRTYSNFFIVANEQYEINPLVDNGSTTSGLVGKINFLEITPGGMIYKLGELKHFVVTQNGAIIGSKVSGVTRAEFDGTGMKIIRADGNSDVQIAQLGYLSGNSSSGTATKPCYTFGTRLVNSSVGNYSMAIGIDVTASAYGSYAEGQQSVSSGVWAHAENSSTASGGYSHAECYGNAIGHYSHSEGSSSAHGEFSHAEGRFTSANASFSHVQNLGTSASGYAQTVIGMYNEISGTSETRVDTDYAFIIGNGNSSTRSNALTVDWNGNVNIASGAKYKINGTNLSASDVGAIATSARDAANGVAPLDANGKLPTANLPTTVGAIETEASNSSYSLANNSWSAVTDCSLSLDAGSWIIYGTAVFPGNSTGRRGIRFRNNTDSTSYTLGTQCINAGGSDQITLSTSMPLVITATKTIIVQAYQSTGSAKPISANINAIRIK